MWSSAVRDIVLYVAYLYQSLVDGGLRRLGHDLIDCDRLCGVQRRSLSGRFFISEPLADLWQTEEEKKIL